MKHVVKSTFVVMAAFFLMSASKPKPQLVEKKYVKLTDALYVGIYEVTNADYKLFLADLKAGGSNGDYNMCLPDSLQWMGKFPFSYLEPYEKMYFNHVAYSHYPVVNITQQAAEMYCQWLTQRYHNQSNRQFKKVEFRLPTEQEWVLAAAALPGHNLPWYGTFAYNANQTYLANVKFRNFGDEKVSFDFQVDGALAAGEVGKYPSNGKGVFDIIGNVAEMVSSGEIKGGSWDNTIDDCGVDKSQVFHLPDPRVGFRVVMEIKER